MTRPPTPLRQLWGRPPIPLALLVTGKLAVLASVIFLVLGFFGVELSSHPVRVLRPIALVGLAAGAAILGASFRALGPSLKVGLPEEDTELRTGGIYRFSRHPIYAGVYLICLASFFYSPHWATAASGVVAVLIHHRIARAEEAFLERRFGQAWLEYKARVRMYL